MSCSQINSTSLESSFVKTWLNYQEEKIDYCENYNSIKDIEKKLLDIISLPFNKTSDEFYSFIKENEEEIKYDIRYSNLPFDLFFMIESYLRKETDIKLEDIEYYLKEIKETDFDASGIKLLRPSLSDGIIVRKAYLSNNKEIIDLFQRYLPKPDANLFKRNGDIIPSFIQEKADEAQKVVEALLQRHNLKTVEQSAIALQRHFRSSQRKKRELKRVMQVEKLDQDKAKKLISTGDKPYMPKCQDRQLAERIFNTAYKVPDAPIIRHITAAQTLPRLFDECLYGRQSLTTRYLPFRPAQLYFFDQENGDANVICFGPQEIDLDNPEDERKSNSVEITLNMKRFKENPIEKRNPCIFFKQQDLGYEREKTRTLEISKEVSIIFSHTTSFIENLKPRHSGFALQLGSESDIKYAQIPFQHLISSNFKSMTAIQTLNFFRYLDSLTDKSSHRADSAIDTIYKAMAQLNDKQLLDLLTEIHTKITDTAEFNFYGAYKIDLELVDKISFAPHGLKFSSSVDLPELIDNLNKGDLSLYKKTKTTMPFLFESNQFKIFLSSKIKYPEILNDS